MKDLHILPRVRDSWSFLYMENCRIEQEALAIAAVDERGRTHIPCASLMLLMLGPGTSITHAAVKALSDNGCMVVWCGEDGIRFYASGTGESRSGRNILMQAKAISDESLRLRVVRKMYQLRFMEKLDQSLTLQQIRGMEGVRVRQAYAEASKKYGVTWSGRNYDGSCWQAADPINKALSVANSCLYGICHCAIVSAGYSAALGFIHTGKQLSFVYDVADFYKTEITIPAAFMATAKYNTGVGINIERETRGNVRKSIKDAGLLVRIVKDIDRLFCDEEKKNTDYDGEAFRPGGLLDEDQRVIDGGVNYAPED